MYVKNSFIKIIIAFVNKLITLLKRRRNYAKGCLT